MPGPKPTPTEILALRGSWRAHGREGEPQFQVEVPDCPSWVPESGREWYRAHAEQAAAAGYMSKPMQTALALGAFALADFLELERQLQESGYTYTTDKGNVLANPLVHLRNTAWKNLLVICREYGFTPASKTGIKVGGGLKPAKDQGKGRFFDAKLG